MNELTPIQHKVIALLAAGRPIGWAAVEVGIHRNTIANWRRDVPAFARALDAATHELALRFRHEFVDLLPASLGVLRTLLHNGDASDSLRLRAALAVIKIAGQPAPPLPDEQATVCEPQPEAPTEAPAPEEGAVNVDMHKLAQASLKTAVQLPIRRPAQPGRNSICPCGSGVKYKRCCANRPATQSAAA